MAGKEHLITPNDLPNRERIVKELNAAYTARANGNAGLARVCARRAVGRAIQETLSTQGIQLPSPSALEHIKYLQSTSDLPPALRKTLGYLTVRVVKEDSNEDSFWPLPEVDLIQEAHWLIETLLGESIDLQSHPPAGLDSQEAET